MPGPTDDWSSPGGTPVPQRTNCSVSPFVSGMMTHRNAPGCHPETISICKAKLNIINSWSTLFSLRLVTLYSTCMVTHCYNSSTETISICKAKLNIIISWSTLFSLRLVTLYSTWVVTQCYNSSTLLRKWLEAIKIYSTSKTTEPWQVFLKRHRFF